MAVFKTEDKCQFSIGDTVYLKFPCTINCKVCNAPYIVIDVINPYLINIKCSGEELLVSANHIAYGADKQQKNKTIEQNLLDGF